jgi:hypothetical protein
MKEESRLWSKTMFLHVEEANYVSDYTVWLRFNDGTSGEVDLANELDGPVFEPLKERSEFRRFELKFHTLSWKNGADFAPEFLHEKMMQQASRLTVS